MRKIKYLFSSRSNINLIKSYLIHSIKLKLKKKLEKILLKNIKISY